jgi:eukaryotic-like serine/threonine-protein kinase
MNEWTAPGYAKVRELGSGATGRVQLAAQDGTGRMVAIKYLSPALTGSSVFTARFREEARLLTELDVEHIARVYSYIEAPGGAAIVMELVDGPTLRAMLEHNGATTPQAALTVLKGSLLGLAAAHDHGIVHRDYKPENVLIDTRGSSKLTDFGIAVRAGRRAPAEGTPLYMAPEQWAGGLASPATDVYAATATFYECLTGSPPYSGNARRLRHEHETAPIPADRVDEPLRGLVRRGLAKEPALRPPNAAAFVAELEDTARREYGADWETTGQAALAAAALALTGAAAGTAAATATAGSGASHGTLIIGAVAGAATIAVVTVLAVHALAGTGHDAPSPQPRQVAAASAVPNAVGTPAPSSTPSAAPSTSDTCVVGSWQTVAETESGLPIADAQYASGTETWQFGASGSGSFTDSAYVLTGGVTSTFNGSIMFTYRVAGDQLSITELSGQLTETGGGDVLTYVVSAGTGTLTLNGTVEPVGSLGPDTGTYQIDCSATRLVLTWPYDTRTLRRPLSSLPMGPAALPR